MFSLGYNLTNFVQHIFLSQWPLCCVQLYLCCYLCCVGFYFKYTVYVSKKVHFAWFIVIILRNGSLHVSVKPSCSLTSIMGGYQSFKQAFISQKLEFKVYRKNSSMQKYIVLIMYMYLEVGIFRSVWVVNCVWFIETLTPYTPCRKLVI